MRQLDRVRRLLSAGSVACRGRARRRLRRPEPHVPALQARLWPDAGALGGDGSPDRRCLLSAVATISGNLSSKAPSNGSTPPQGAEAISQGDAPMKLVPATLAMLLAGSLAAMAHDIPAEVAKSPPAGAFKAVSSLVKLPDFLPGMGQLFVDPATPAGRSVPRLRPRRRAGQHHLHAADRRTSIRTRASTILPRPAAMSTTSTSTTMPAIPASKSRMSMSCCGMSPAADEAKVAQ